MNVLTQKDWHLWVKGLQNYPKLTFYLKSWGVSFKFVRNQPLLFCNYPLIFNKFITILFVQQIDLVWRSQPQNLMLKILVVYRCFYKLIFPIYYCCPIGLKKHSFADETCSAGFYPGDPFCNDANNNAECNYDNGACCDHWTVINQSWTLWDYFCTVRNHLISILF